MEEMKTRRHGVQATGHVVRKRNSANTKPLLLSQLVSCSQQLDVFVGNTGCGFLSLIVIDCWNKGFVYIRCTVKDLSKILLAELLICHKIAFMRSIAALGLDTHHTSVQSTRARGLHRF